MSAPSITAPTETAPSKTASMRFHVISVLPEIFGSFVSTGILARAIAGGSISIEVRSPRDHATDRHRSVDDTPYGGGSGMVMAPGPLVEAMEAVDQRERELAALGVANERPLRVLLTPQGERFDQQMARSFAADRRPITLVCGRYEGIDERARARCDREVSIGDFVLMGGEVAAMAIIEAVARLIPGVLGNSASLDEESHAQGRLEYPHYTRPAEFRGERVPEVLTSGHHGQVAEWRRRKSLERTLARRPDLLERFPPDAEERALLDEIANEQHARTGDA